MHEVIRTKSHNFHALEQRLYATEVRLRNCENEKRSLYLELLTSSCGVTDVIGVERGSE